jgi:hypothetical protein
MFKKIGICVGTLAGLTEQALFTFDGIVNKENSFVYHVSQGNPYLFAACSFAALFIVPYASVFAGYFLGETGERIFDRYKNFTTIPILSKQSQT